MEVERITSYDTASGEPADALDSEHCSKDQLFESKYFTREDFAPFTLPYGTLCGSDGGNTENRDTSSEGSADPKAWAASVFQDCISFIRGNHESNETFEWYHDFIAFTNLQAAVYSDRELLKDGEDLYLILDYTNKHVRNLRSSVAKNALFFVGCIIEATEHDSTLFVAVALRLLPHLFKCSTSEKIVYRKPAIHNIVSICQRCRSSESIAIAWMLMDHARDRSPKICAAATIAMQTFFDNFDTDMLVTLDLEDVAEHFEPCLGGRNAALKKLCSGLVIKIAERLPTDTLHAWVESAASKPNLKKLLKPYVPSPVLSEPSVDEPNDQTAISASSEMLTNNVVSVEVKEVSSLPEEKGEVETTCPAATETNDEPNTAETTEDPATEENEGEHDSAQSPA
ncbi:hypothetical protein, conserved [Babesia bigemina]|uniref:CLASP N-terminal domain-containing protein n=1 Tax=Babesia bigemina TaxID=5866 RepID=A0A061DEQ5_BABBI|nr:hypothetical protein, conserved [Babesia bigemina]CDR97690.1 hypothetical protein, conserved [Babesia bigemina]|eukprot:XP_012769876.1 hypothetical protein, conserved [Babesia bigemina]